MPTVPVPQVTPATFATSLLQAVGAPPTPQNVSSLVAWQAREGGNWHNTAAYNPLNTTLDAPGSKAINGVGVKAYQNWNQGVQATANTLKNGDYTDVLGALHSGKGLTGSLQGLSKWSGGGYSSLDGVSSSYKPAPVPGAAKAAAPAKAPVANTQDSAQARLLSNALGAGLPSPVAGLLYSHIQSNLIDAHGDLQRLAGTTTLTTPPGTGEGGSRLSSMVKAADSLVGKPYVWGGGHAGFTNQAGYDCSGFVSAVLHAGGFLNTPQTTQTLPSQPSIASGPGKYVTVYDRTDGGTPNNDHVIIDLNGAWYESGGQSGTWGGGGGVQKIQTPAASYLASFNRELHPKGL
jgi:cell wall-associated NlpC family hydrolase